MTNEQKRRLLQATNLLADAVAALHSVYESDLDTFNSEQPDSLCKCYAMSLDEWEAELSVALADIEKLPTVD